MTFKPLVFIGLFMCLVGLQPLLAQVNAFDRPGTVNSDLQLTKTADKSIARVGSIVNFTVKVKNLGPNMSEGSTVFDLLPNGFTFISSSLPAEYNSISGEWDVDELEVNAEATLVITATVNPITPTSIYTNVVQIFDVKNTDPNPANNRAEFTVVPFDFRAEVTGEFTGVGGAICANSAATLRATSTNIIEPIYKWYADAQLANLLHIGANYTTPALSFTTTYYLVVTGTNIPVPIAADAKQVTVNVLEVPVVPVATVTHPTCEFAKGTITVTSPLAPGYLYSLDGATYLNNSGVFTNIAPGTYAVSIKNANGCIGANANVVVNPRPEGPAAPSLDIVQPTCDLGTGTIKVTSPKNTGNTYSINGVDYSNTTGVFTQVAAGTYTVTVKNASGCISSGTSAIVNANPLTPQTPEVASTDPLCPAKTGTITVSSPVGSGFTYSIDGGSYLNNGGVFSSVLPGTYNVSVKNASGCVSPSVVVTIKDPVVDEPKLTISANGSTSICQGSSVVLTSSESVSYQWYKYGVAIAGANSKTYTASTEGIYSVSRVYNIPGCSGIQSDGIDVKLSVLPIAPVVVVAQPSCEISTGTITVTSPIAEGNTYSINGVDYSNTTGVFTQVAAGTYTVTVKNASGCISSGTSAIVNANPLTPQTPEVASTDPLCPAKTGTITVSSPVGSGFTYSIDGGSYLNNGGVFSSVLPGTYNVSVKNASGCVSPSVVVTIKDPVVDEPKLTISANGSTSICQGSSVVLTSSESVSYQWYKYGVAIAGANSKTYTASTEGIYSVSRVYNIPGCSGIQSDGIDVKLSVLPIAPVVVVAQPSCEISTGTITVTSPIAEGNTYSINGVDYSNTTGVFTQVAAGTYTVTVKNASGCISSGTSAIVNANPLTPQTPEVASTDPLCPAKTGTITVSSPVGSGFTYSIDGGSYLNNGGVFSSVLPGTYNVSVKNASGCVSPSVVVTIKDPVVDEPKLTITSSSSTSICVGSSVLLTSSNAPSYQWYKNGIAIAGANAKTFNASTEGVYTVSRFNNNGCVAIQSDGVEVKVVANPLTPLVTADKMLFCDGDSVVLNGTAAFGLQWFKDGIAITGATSNRLVVKQGGTYAALAINNNGCRSSFSEALVIKMVDLPVTPVLTIKGTTKFCKDETRLLQVNVPTGLTINWYKNSTLISAYTKDTLRVKEAAEYTVKFVNSNGCFSLVSNKILTEIGCNTTGIYIPDIFSPNGDGINETIKPVCVGISKFKYFKVYNRWGNILFETTDEGKAWDGKFRGQVQPADSYIWLVEGLDTNGKEIRKTGVLNLIK